MPVTRFLFLVSICFLWACNSESDPSEAQTPERPNILLIMADDMGYTDLGFFGSRIKTPHLDRLAGNGLVFSQFYNTSRCCPSRAALLTGLYQHQAGVGEMTKDFQLPAYRGRLNDQCATLAELLQPAGYQTMMSGKWHLGNAREFWPTERGFEQFYGIPEGGGVYYYPFNKDRQVVLNDSILQPDSTYYTTYAFNDYAETFIDQATEQEAPFFLYLAHIAPHFPLQAPEAVYNKYIGQFKLGLEEHRNRRLQAMKDKGIIDPDMTLSQPDAQIPDWSALSETQKDSLDLKMAIYAAQLEILDDGVGRLLQLLEEKDELDNTLILFLSDNGGSYEESGQWDKYDHLTGAVGDRNSYESLGRAWANVSNTPFRMYKHWVHEGGISSPLLVHYPDLVKQARIDTNVLHIMDIVPTCLELAGATYPDTLDGHALLPLEGQSFASLLKGESWTGHDMLFWEHRGNRAARKGPWKIVSSYPEDQWRLYHIPSDRVE
ncbi:MAG: arylsulfatase, partial [Phaeodactylibacter sp.]|nr:arylsulfatase [Phaeodactylibacter sp.]